MTSYRNLHHALPNLLSSLLENGEKHDTRNGMAYELLAETVTLARPWERYQLVPGRNANPFAQLAETLWVLSGYNDVEWLSFYLPRAKDFSDDGKTWRAGYGPRLREWPQIPRFQVGVGNPVVYGVDQVEEVLRLLEDAPDTRRAVINLWNPAEDNVASKDIPCNNWVHFQVRAGKLHMSVVIRSNDVMWGWSGINTFEWSVLHEILAYSLGLDMGPVNYFLDNLHLYSAHESRARNIIAKCDTADHALETMPYEIDSQPNLCWNLQEFDRFMARSNFWRWERSIRKDASTLLEALADTHVVAFRDVYRMLDVYARCVAGDISEEAILHRIEAIERSDWKAVALDWFHRQARKLVRITLANANVFELVGQLQPVKDRLYGGSWKRYGEKASIFPNIARKFDRLEVLEAQALAPQTETLLDTIVDLGTYATMYYAWLEGISFEEALKDVQKHVRAVQSTEQRLGKIQLAFHDLAKLLEVEEGLLAFHTTKEACAMALATQAFCWVEELRDSAGSDWRKFIAYVESFTKEHIA